MQRVYEENEWGNQGNTERFGIGKSRCIESENLGKGTERVNAVLRLCGGLGTAQSFFESEDSLVYLPLAWMAWALALEADDEDFGQSFVEWPGPPQNMHKLLLKQHCLSCRSTFCLCQACQRWMWSFQRRTEDYWVSCFCQTCCSCCCCRIFCLCCWVCCHCCQTCSFRHRIFHGGVPNDGDEQAPCLAPKNAILRPSAHC